ncbi:hypothetical protein DESC_270021 [Desulfosarcina cetonica]|nr:hypothetical protein DESC_270021 [Desulfosarcina cetonica]
MVFLDGDGWFTHPVSDQHDDFSFDGYRPQGRVSPHPRPAGSGNLRVPAGDRDQRNGTAPEQFSGRRADNHIGQIAAPLGAQNQKHGCLGLDRLEDLVIGNAVLDQVAAVGSLGGDPLEKFLHFQLSVLDLFIEVIGERESVVADHGAPHHVQVTLVDHIDEDQLRAGFLGHPSGIMDGHCREIRQVDRGKDFILLCHGRLLFSRVVRLFLEILKGSPNDGLSNRYAT